jgi:putative tryptophan/tyrosine transport system substrate-binding protein
MLRRRDFITLLGGAAVGWPLTARAQQPAVPTIGVLELFSPKPNGSDSAAFRQGLAETGLVDGKNVTIESHWAYGEPTRSGELVADLVRRRVAAIAAFGIGPAFAAKAATSTIPIIFAVGLDPVKYGLVASLNRPGGNVTGATDITHELAAKRLGLLCELVPEASTVAYLSARPNLTSKDQATDIVAAGRELHREVIVTEVRSITDLQSVFASLVERAIHALIVGAFPLFHSNIDKVVSLAVRHTIPAIYPGRDYAVAGGLMSYGSLEFESHRQVGLYTGRILNGAKPADLPVLQPTKFELVINLKAAKTLGLNVPQTLLVAADEVIE